MDIKGVDAREAEGSVEILERRVVAHKSVFRLANGDQFEGRRYFPAGKGDRLRFTTSGADVHVRHDDAWLAIDPAWTWSFSVALGPQTINLTFKEIETAAELAQFESLRRFHYRGGGGAGRTVPLIATSDLWDLPSVLGFIEISSSMIANTARKRFLNMPYFEADGPRWQEWDTATSKKYSNAICRISRFVIHPEIRGLGIAKAFLEAAREYSRDRWHYGGMRPRFLEITADMLKYYKFVDRSFAYMGETEGNEHRVAKDMTYLVKKALTVDDRMPQGGGGIMTLQRGYASQLMRYLDKNERTLPQVIASLRHDPSMLDQETWESLHRINRRPKASYISALTPIAQAYLLRRQTIMSPEAPTEKRPPEKPKKFSIENVTLNVTSKIAQTSEARHLQDAFGFVGSELSSEIIRDLSFEVSAGELTLICGASGSGKSLLLRACSNLLGDRQLEEPTSPLSIQGRVDRTGTVAELPILPLDKTPLDLRGRASLEKFLRITAKCGLAEPQLFVRPISSLSSGQQYRLQVALAFMSGPDVVAIDNFCEPLDRFTALAVIRGIKQLASELGVAVLAATAAYDRLNVLPDIDQAILLRRGDKPIVTQDTGPDGLQKGFLLQPLPREGAE